MPVVRHFEDGHKETLWAAGHRAQPDGLEVEDVARAVPVTQDPMTLPASNTRHLVTNLPRPPSPDAGEASMCAADLPEVLRLDGLCLWVTQSIRHVAQELGWEDVMVRSPRAALRHWELVSCALVFCWETWLAQPAAGAGETPPDGWQGDPLMVPVCRLLPNACRPAWAVQAPAARARLPRPPAGIPPRVVVDRSSEQRIEEDRRLVVAGRHLGREPDLGR